MEKDILVLDVSWFKPIVEIIETTPKAMLLA